MTVLVTGSSGHLGEALVTTLRDAGESVVGVDVLPSDTTDVVAGVQDRETIFDLVRSADEIVHSATLHKPHVVTHSRQQFVDTNISGTLALLDAAVEYGNKPVVFISTTSVFGHAMRPGPDDDAVWVTEDLQPVPRNIYGVTKVAAENLCELMHRRDGLPVLILRTSRFFPEIDDDEARRAGLADENLKTVEFLHRRVDIEDVVSAVHCGRARTETLGFGRWIISAPSPFGADDLPDLRRDAWSALDRRVPRARDWFRQLGWSLPSDLDRVYDSSAAVAELGWQPRHGFVDVVQRMLESGSWRSPLALRIGKKGYHSPEVAAGFEDGPFPVEPDRSAG